MAEAPGAKRRKKTDDGAAITRRSMVGVCLGIPVIAWARPLLARDRIRRFREVSAQLTGFQEHELDPRHAVEIMEGLIGRGQEAVLVSLLAGRNGAKETEVARKIVVAWYSGVHPEPGGPVTHTYEDALAWKAIGFSHPSGFCTAPLFHWATPPQP